MFTSKIRSAVSTLKYCFLSSSAIADEAQPQSLKSPTASATLKSAAFTTKPAADAVYSHKNYPQSPPQSPQRRKPRSPLACKTGTYPVWSHRDYESLATVGYSRNVVVFRCVNLIAKSLSSISWSTYETRADGSEYALENHPILQLLQIPYPNVSGAFFLESVFSQLMLSGNAYIRIGTREAGQKSAESAAIYTRPQKELVAGAMQHAGFPQSCKLCGMQHAGFPQSCKLCGMQRRRRAVQAVPLKPSTEATNQQTFCGRVYLQCLRSDKVCVLIDENGTHVGFQYKDGSAEKFFPIDPSGMCDILHLKTFNPLSDWYGMSPIEAASRSIDQHNAVGEHNLSILQNGGRPSGALLIKPPKNGLTLTQEQRESLRDDLCSMYQGVENAGRLAVIEGECEWKEMGLSPKDLDFNKGKNMSAREIAQAFGVPPILLGMTEDATFSNYKEARINFWEDTLLPLLNHLISELNMWLVPRFCQNLRLDYDKDNIPALAARRDYVWAKMQESAFLTINEKRQALGYCPVAGGDTIV